jgi:hypothetical protein
MTSNIREFLRARADEHPDPSQAAEIRALVNEHMPESVGYYDPKEKTGENYTVCEICGPVPTIDTAWPCAPLRTRAAAHRDHQDYDHTWDNEQ